MIRVALACLILSGCAPTLVWHGRGPDRARELRVEEVGDAQRLVLDGEVLGQWEAVGLEALAWTASGEPVYAVRDESGWRVGVGRALGPAYEAVGVPAVAGDRVAYPALDEEGWRVVDGGDAGPVFRSILAGTITLASEGRRLAYVGRDGGGARAVVDGRVGPAFDDVLGLEFGAKGALVVYAGFDAEGASLVVDGEVAGRFDDLRELAAADDAPTWAAIVDTAEGRAVVHGSRRHAAPRAEGLVIAADGGAVAWRQGDALVVDGREAARCPSIERLGLVPPANAPVFACRRDDGVRVHGPGGSAGPRFDSVDGPLTRGARWGYVGHRRGAGSAVVIDGALVHRGEWAGALQLGADGHAFLARRGGRRFVITAGGETRVPRPFVDTLIYDRGHWAVAVADRPTRALRIWVDGRAVAGLDTSEVASALATGRDATDAVRAVVRGELERATE